MTEVEVSLAPLDSTDMGWVREGRNDHNVWKWCRQHNFISDAEQIRWFNRQSEDPTIKMWKIVCQSDEKKAPIGVCGLTSIDYVNRRGEFSLWIKPALQGRGLGKVALSLLLEHGFSNFGLNLIWGESFAGNQAIRMFEALGFKRDGLRRAFYFRDGRFIDAHLYSILAEEFYASRARGLSADEPAPARGADVVGLPRPDPEGSPEPDQRECEGSSEEPAATEAG